MTETPDGLLAVRITPGKHPEKYSISLAQARYLNEMLWEKLCLLYDGINSRNLATDTKPDASLATKKDKDTPNVFWMNPDPRTSSIFGILVEVIGTRPEGERIEAMIEQIVYDVLGDGYEIRVFFSINPVS